MPKYYCDYCDTHLTHDSPSVRKTHCSGRKHRDNVRNYYQKWMEEQAQQLIDVTTAAYKTKINKIDLGTMAAVPPPGYPFQMPQTNFSVPPPNMKTPMINTQTYMGVTNLMTFNGPTTTPTNCAPPTGVPPPVNMSQFNLPPPSFNANYGLMLANYNQKHL